MNIVSLGIGVVNIEVLLVRVACTVEILLSCRNTPELSKYS